MSVVFSGTVQGTFVGTGQNILLPIREGVDWINVYNTTVAAASQTTAIGVQYYWQFGMPPGAMIAYFKSNAAAAANLTQYLTTGGFYPYNNTINIPGPSVALTAISTGTPPVVSTTNTAGLVNGSVVRIFNTTNAQQFGGVDFTIGNVITNTSFTLAYAPTISPAGTSGTFRMIPYDPYFYPPTRVISNISNATQAIVTLNVTHAYTIGQVVRFVIPTVTSTSFGMTQLDGVAGTIVNIGQSDVNGYTNTITVDVDTTSFGTFAWPVTTDPFTTLPQIVPVGENTAQAIASNVNLLGDSEVNIGQLGITLTGGQNHPGGANGNVMFWVAGKSFSGGL
jgi:hypothetical protein